MVASQTLKIAFVDEMRRLPYDSEKGVQGVLDLCVSCFNLKNPAAFHLTYQDSEGDTIVLSSNEELATLFKSADTVKLTLQRKACKKGALKPAASSEGSSSSSTPESPAELKTKKDKQEKKKARKEKKEALKKEILNTKVVRIRWKALNEVPAPAEGEKPLCPRRLAKKQHRGCYVGTSLKGKIKFNAGLGKKSLWLSHELAGDGGVMFSPVSSPRRYLRVCPDGTVNLSNGGVGPRTRWTRIVDGDSGTSQFISKFNNQQLTGVSVGKKLKNRNKKGGKKRVVARCLNLSSTSASTSTASAPENLAAKQFWIEEVEVTQLLISVVKKLSKRRRTARRLRKEGRKNWKKNLKTQEKEVDRKSKGKGRGKGKGKGKGKEEKGKCKGKKEKKCKREEEEQQPAVHPFRLGPGGLRAAEYIC